MYISTTHLGYFALGAGIVFLIMLVLVVHLEFKVRRFLKGQSGTSLESSIVTLHSANAEHKQFTSDMEKYLLTVEKRLKQSIQGVGTIRYNAFEGTGQGGNNSFSIALINEKGDGSVLTSLYAREKVSLFAKPVKNFASEFELTEEERDALNTAKENLKIE